MPLRLTLSTQGSFNKSIRQVELDMNNSMTLPSLLPILHFSMWQPLAPPGKPREGGVKQMLVLMAGQPGCRDLRTRPKLGLLSVPQCAKDILFTFYSLNLLGLSQHTSYTPSFGERKDLGVNSQFCHC